MSSEVIISFLRQDYNLFDYYNSPIHDYIDHCEVSFIKNDNSTNIRFEIWDLDINETAEVSKGSKDLIKIKLNKYKLITQIRENKINCLLNE